MTELCQKAITQPGSFQDLNCWHSNWASSKQSHAHAQIHKLQGCFQRSITWDHLDGSLGLKMNSNKNHATSQILVWNPVSVVTIPVIWEWCIQTGDQKVHAPWSINHLELSTSETKRLSMTPACLGKNCHHLAPPPWHWFGKMPPCQRKAALCANSVHAAAYESHKCWKPDLWTIQSTHFTISHFTSRAVTDFWLCQRSANSRNYCLHWHKGWTFEPHGLCWSGSF